MVVETCAPGKWLGDEPMIVKLIRASVRPGCRDEFIRRQRVWNDVMSRQAGFLGVQVAIDAARPDDVWIWIAMQSRDALERFMQTDHDAVMAATRMADTYDELEIRILEGVEPGPPVIRMDIAPSRAGQANQLVFLSEAYRLSAVMRAATLAGLFDALDEDGTPVGTLAERCGVRREYVERLVGVLAALQLVTISDGRVTSAPIARRHLVRGGAAYIGDLLIHNTRPLAWQRWGNLPDLLGIDRRADTPDELVLFLRAMGNIAAAGQAAALLRAIDLNGRRRLLDVGGGEGDYAIALCRAYPALSAVVFDQPRTSPLARVRISEAGLDDRVRFEGGDYRDRFPDGEPFDSLLLSNICRGETPGEVARLIGRAWSTLAPGGVLYVQDLFMDEPNGRGPLLAACFGLHMPDAMNASGAEVMNVLRAAGFRSVTEQRLDGYVVANSVITAVR